MLADSNLSGSHRIQQKSDLQYATNRALALGNDITSQYNLDVIEQRVRTFSHSKIPAIYSVKQCKLHQSILGTYLNTYEKRVHFWKYYYQLRQLGQTRKQILQTVYDVINEQSL